MLDPTVERLQTIEEGENAEELSGQFEGDIILSPEQIGELTLRNGLNDEKYSWPNHTVVYEITDDFDEEQRDFIRKALDEMEAVTCLKFIPRTDEESYIRVTVRWFVGYTYGEIVVVDRRMTMDGWWSRLCARLSQIN